MIQVRRSNERGHANHGWLNSHHTFSFAGYHDPQFMGFGPLRVINEDRVTGGQGFGAHPHNNMEIISYVVDGALEHKDSMGTGSVMRAGDVQLMSAGTGVTHSEFNASKTDPVHFLQIWVIPAERNTAPRYQQKNFDKDAQPNQWHVMVTPDEQEQGALHILQDVQLLGAVIDEGTSLGYEARPDRRLWLQVVRGQVRLPDGTSLVAGDGAAMIDEATLELHAVERAEVILFDMM